MIKSHGVLNPLYEFLSVLDMNSIVLDLGVKYILQTVFAHEFIGQDSNAFPYFIFQVLATPHFPQTFHRIHFLFYPTDLHHELWKGYSHVWLVYEIFCFWWFLNESENCLPIVFRNVFGIISDTGVMANSITGFFSFVYRLILGKINFWFTV